VLRPRNIHDMRWTARLALLGLLLLAAAAAGEARAECSPGQQQEADLAYNSAFQFINAGQWEQAVPRLLSTLEICPDHIPSLNALGRAYKELGKYAEAKLIYEKLIAARGQDAEAGDYANLGTILTYLKNYKDARVAFVKAQSIAPDDCGVLFNLGILNMAVEDYRHSVSTFEELLDKCENVKERALPKLAEACRKAADKEKKIGNSERAEQYLVKYRQYSGEAGGSTAYDRVKVLMKNRQFAEAVPLLEKLVAEDPERPAFLLSLARCQDALDRKDEACLSYEKYLAVKPEDERTTADLIMTFAEAGQCQKGIAKAQEAETHFLSKGRKYLAKIYYAWGMALECGTQYADAKEMFAKAMTAGDPQWVEPARQQVQRQEEFLQLEAAKRRRAAQGG